MSEPTDKELSKADAKTTEWINPGDRLPPEFAKIFVKRGTGKNQRYSDRARELCKQFFIGGWTLQAIENATGVSAGVVSRWSRDWPKRERVNGVPQPIPAHKLGGVAPGTIINALTKVPRQPTPVSKELAQAIETLNFAVRGNIAKAEDPVKQAKGVVLAVALEQALAFAKNPPPVEKWGDLNTIFGMIEKLREETESGPKSDPHKVDVEFLKIKPTPAEAIEKVTKQAERAAEEYDMRQGDIDDDLPDFSGEEEE